MENEYLTKAEHNEYVRRIEDWQNRQDARLKEAETHIDEITKLSSSIERLAVSMENMQKELTKQGTRLESLEKKDAELWQTVVKYVITAVVGGVVTFILAKIGIV